MNHAAIVEQLIDAVKARPTTVSQGGKTSDYVTYARFSPRRQGEVEVGITLLGGVRETEDARQFRNVLEGLGGRISVFGPIGQGCVDENAFRISGVVPVPPSN